jgi:hypothetical protein
MPSKGDTYELRDWKYHQIYQHFCKNYLGCRVTFEDKRSVALQLIPMSKASLIYKAIKESFQQAVHYVRLTEGLNPDTGCSPFPPNVMDHPVVQVAVRHCRAAQGQLDRLDHLIKINREEEILTDAPVVGFNPTGLDKAKEIRVLGDRGQTPKGVHGLINLYIAQKRAALSDEQATLLPVVINLGELAD